MRSQTSAVVALLISALVPAMAQVAAPDRQRLEDALFQARTAISLLRTGDFRLRGELTEELDRVRTEVSALVSNQAAGRRVDRAVLLTLLERVDAVRRRARGPESVTGMGLGPMAVAPSRSPETAALDVPPGTTASVRLLHAVDLGSMQLGDRVEAVTAEPIRSGSRLIAPAGSLLRGLAEAPGPGTLVFDQILINVTTYRIRATAVVPRTADVMRAGVLVTLRLDPPDAAGLVR